MAATETFKQVWEAKAEGDRAKEMVAEALVRHGLLEAMLDGIGHRQRAERMLARLEKQVEDEFSRPAVIAKAVLDRELDEQEFRSRARKAGLAEAEVELVLAANACYAERHLAKAQHLRLAWEAVVRDDKSLGWPYELIKFNQDAAMKPPL